MDDDSKEFKVSTHAANMLIKSDFIESAKSQPLEEAVLRRVVHDPVVARDEQLRGRHDGLGVRDHALVGRDHRRAREPAAPDRQPAPGDPHHADA